MVRGRKLEVVLKNLGSSSTFEFHVAVVSGLSFCSPLVFGFLHGFTPPQQEIDGFM